MHFNAEKTRDHIVGWIRDWFSENGRGCKAVLGISGGKDSTVAAALCVRALGKERVVGVMMPNITQPDIDDSIRVCEILGIRSLMMPVTVAVGGIQQQLEFAGVEPSVQACVNLPARIRMVTLYAVSQSVGGRVVNTSNLSEKWIGWGTRFGDTVGDLCPLAGLTASEVVEVGRTLGLPEELVAKTPSDGLTGKSDEENFGFSYEELDGYIRTGKIRSQIPKNRIDRMHRMCAFKLSMPPVCDPGLPIAAESGEKA